MSNEHPPGWTEELQSPEPLPVPRVWPSLLFGFFGPAILGIAVMMPLVLIDPRIADMDFETPSFALVLLLAISQVMLIAFSLGAAKFTPIEPGVESRLALRPNPWPWWKLAVLILGGGGLELLVMFAYQGLGVTIPEDPQWVTSLLETADGPFVAALFVGGVIGAPLAEELFYRGFMLQGLLRKWPHLAGLCILLTSWAFASQHDPGYAIFLLPFGIYAGVLTYYSRSIVPAMWAHAYNNLLAFSGEVLPEDVWLWLFRAPGEPNVFEIGGLIALPFAIWLLLTHRPAEPGDSEETTPEAAAEA